MRICEFEEFGSLHPAHTKTIEIELQKQQIKSKNEEKKNDGGLISDVKLTHQPNVTNKGRII